MTDKTGRQSKRARISDAKPQTQRGESIASDSDDESLPDADADDNDDELRPPATQYEQIRDNGWEHLANPDNDDRKAEKKFLARHQMIGENHAADNSIIKEITCINFMCHSKLHVELGPLINFVVGMNGSGKSAVLTAITLCLAGKTSSTFRGNSMKGFVKSGCEQGLLIVKLKNEGDDAYQPELFGDTITVERHFSKSGSNGYKLKTSTGRIISTKKSDIEEIVEYFQLQVDNPMTVLNQDRAKSFLTKATAAEKYKFFEDGVQLKALDADYKIVSEYCDSLAVKLRDMDQNLRILKKKADVAKGKAEMVQKHDGVRRAARKIRNQLAWAQVEMMEEKLVTRSNDVDEAQAKIDEYERKAADLDVEFQQADDHLERAREAQKVVEQEQEPLNLEVEEAKAASKTANDEVATHRATEDEIKTAMKEGTAKVKKLEADIKTEERRLEDVNGGSHNRMRAEIEKAKKEAEAARAAYQESQDQMPDIEAKYKQTRGEADEAERVVKAKGNDLSNARGRLDEMMNKRGDIMAAFDPRMPQLINAIRRDNEFREQPVGPIGLHITLTDAIWTTLVERTIGNNLGGFVVTSKSDSIRLTQMIAKSGVRRPVPVLIGNSQPIDTSAHEPEQGQLTLMRALKIDNELIRKQLIILHSIEQTALFKDVESAQAYMFPDNGQRPRNVRAALAINKFTPSMGHHIGGGGDNSRALAPVQAWVGPSRVKTDAESQVRHQQEIVKALEVERNEFDNRKRQAQQQMKNAAMTSTRHSRTIASLKIDVQKADERVESLQIELEQDVIEDGKLEHLQEQLAAAHQSVTIAQESYGNSALERKRLNELALVKKRELDALKTRLADHEQKINKAKQKVKSREESRRTILPRKNEALEYVREYTRAKEATMAKRDRQAEQTAEYVRQATEICERVSLEEGETSESLDKKFKALKTQLDNYQRQQGASDAEIQNQAVDTALAFDAANAAKADIAELHQLLKQAFAKRLSMFRAFQQHISARSRINFNYLLSERAFRGKLEIDHKRKVLDVHVEPDATKKGSGRQTKTLSGGEKSFSNICLLLALWEAMGQPLRCLDEFDVFMDDVNRDVSTKMIVRFLHRFVGFPLMDHRSALLDALLEDNSSSLHQKVLGMVLTAMAMERMGLFSIWRRIGMLRSSSTFHSRTFTIHPC